MTDVPETYPSPVHEAVLTALIAVGWDCHDPRPCAGMVFALADEMRAAGISYYDTATMFRNIADSLDSMAESGVIE